MKTPINWLKNYITLKHSNREFGDILTDLEFMQDGPIKNINGEPVIDLEVRQNRPDVLSILGVAREYAAYTNQKVKEPKSLDIKFSTSKKLLKVEEKQKVKRFIAVEIKNIKNVETPKEISKYIEAYGIPTINFIVDVTNYVMLEYGIPMHAFDLDKLEKDGESYLKFRNANKNESFTTWQGTKVTLDTEDLVVTDGKGRLVSIGGITGEAYSGITEETKNILLEAANYDYASVRRTALKTNLQTDSATRHSKDLRSDIVDKAVNRAAYLITKYAGGKIEKTEDYYGIKDNFKNVKLEIRNIERLGGIAINKKNTEALLKRLGFEIDSSSEEYITVTPPKWRSDINFEEDVIEDVLRLNGYDKIPVQDINSAPPKKITPSVLVLEQKLRDICVSLGLDEQITEPLVKYQSENKLQIKLENPLNSDKDSLRTDIKDTLEEVVKNYKKSKIDDIKVFEVGKIYYRDGKKFVEEKVLTALYDKTSFLSVKKDLIEIISRLGLEAITSQIQDNTLVFFSKKHKVATLKTNTFTIFTENIDKLVNHRDVPTVKFSTSVIQTIEENLTVQVNKDTNLEEYAQQIKNVSKYISQVYIADTKKDIYKKDDKYNVTFTITYADPQNTMNKEKLEQIRKKIQSAIQNLG